MLDQFISNENPVHATYVASVVEHVVLLQVGRRPAGCPTSAERTRSSL